MVRFTGKVMARAGNKQLSRDDAPYRIKSRDFPITSGEHACIQSKPNMTGTGTAGITCFEAAPRFASGIAGGKLVGFYANPDLKGTTGNVGPMRCFEGKLETSATCTRTITVACVLEAMSNMRGTVTQGPTVILVNTGEYKAWESVMELKGTEAGVWNDDPATEVDGSAKGYFKVIVNGNNKYVRLYDAGSLAD